MSVPQPTDVEPLCAYERERAARILRNRQVMGGKDPCLQRYLPQPDACKFGTSAGWLGDFFCMRRGHGSVTASDAVPGRLQGGQGTPPTEEGKGGLAMQLHPLCRALHACMFLLALPTPVCQAPLQLGGDAMRSPCRQASGAPPPAWQTCRQRTGA